MISLDIRNIKLIKGDSNFKDFAIFNLQSETGAYQLTFDIDTATKLYEAIQETLWDESEHQNVLRDRVEELESRLEELESDYEDVRDRYDSIPSYVKGEYLDYE